MANQEHLEILKQGVDAWNRWREENPNTRPELSVADLYEADLREANLREADLYKAKLTGANFTEADLNNADLSKAYLMDVSLIKTNLTKADLTGADLTEAYLNEANFSYANLSEISLAGAYLATVNLTMANLSRAYLGLAHFSRADLSGTKLSGAILRETVLSDIDLSKVQGLETCRHTSPSTIDHRTLARSGPLPLSFLRGVGLPDTFIDYIPSLFNQPLQFYSCFISYSSRDEEFVKRLHADLQDKGVRCWYAPEDLPIGAKIRVGIDEAIRKHDKLLLILSEHSVNSQWVEQEVETALEKEREREQLVLFPVRLDDAFMDSRDGWTRLIKNTRNVGDFTRWKDYDAYQKGLERLVRDLKAALTTKG